MMSNSKHYQCPFGLSVRKSSLSITGSYPLLLLLSHHSFSNILWCCGFVTIQVKRLPLGQHHLNFSVYVEPFKASSRYIDYMTMGDSIYNAEGGFSLTVSYQFFKNLREFQIGSHSQPTITVVPNMQSRQTHKSSHPTPALHRFISQRETGFLEYFQIQYLSFISYTLIYGEYL